MAKQKTIDKLRLKLNEQESNKIDLVIPAKNILIQDGLIHINNINEFNTLFDDDGIKNISITPSQLCLDQLADKLTIGRTFQRKLIAEDMPLFEHIVNALLNKNPTKKFLFRISKENDNYTGRALLSNSFKVIDNLAVLEIILDAIAETKNTSVVQSYSIHNKRFVVKFLFDSPNNDYQCGLSVTNSEVGFGKFSIASFIEKENICFIDSYKLEKTHLGSRLNLGNHRQNGLVGKENIFTQIVFFIDYLKQSFYAEKISEIESLFVDSIEKPYEVVNAILKKVLSFHKENENVERIFVKNYIGKSIPSTSIELMKIVSEYITTYYPEELYLFESTSIELLSEINKNKL